MDWSYTIWIPLIPLISFLVLGFLGRNFRYPYPGLIGVSGVFIALVLSYYAAYNYFFVANPDMVFEPIKGFEALWMNFTDTLQFKMGTLIDPISMMMVVVVTTVSFLVHVYSLGYMKEEAGFGRFYTFLSLFTFSMLGLVLATNLFQIYFFWELVGVSSYLLIGFYYDKPSAILASKKAFIVTRFADFFFLIGIILVSYYTNTFDFITLNSLDQSAITSAAGLGFMGMSVLAWGLTLAFIGGAGKSAMFPLHIWLPDAMEGPTPVSALIHAATMVVAGVFLVARLFPMYYSVDGGTVLHIIAFIGAFSSLFAATIALTQLDIKRVLAYSTMSQIGYMMMSLGVSGYEGHHGLGYTASMFHLFTHAFFKSLLFLGAGAIIHAVHSNYMNEMGGLRKYLPITHTTFLIAALAIAGIFPLAGFFSKDAILDAAYMHNQLYFWTGWIVAGMTAFYMFRLYFRVFWFEDVHYHHTPHEAPKTMTIPLLILAVLSVVAGLVFFYFIPFGQYITPTGEAFKMHINWNLAGLSLAIAGLGIFIAWKMYYRKNELPDKISKAFGAMYKWSFDKFYFDEIYNFVTKKIMFGIISRSWTWFDTRLVDGTMDRIGFSTEKISNGIKHFQSGKLQDYAYAVLAGVVFLMAIFVYFLNN
ncbi:MAG: NADH-quinone oxidoreductase subunit L [Deltaproteobacteria bacterium]